jgi:hypothetical protein
MALHIAQALGAAGVGTGDLGQAFAAGTTRTGRVSAHQTAKADAQVNGTTLPGQVGEGSLVMAVTTTRGRPAGGTERRRRVGRREDHDPVGPRANPNDTEAIGHEWEKASGHRSGPGRGRIPACANRVSLSPPAPHTSRKNQTSGPVDRWRSSSGVAGSWWPISAGARRVRRPDALHGQGRAGRAGRGCSRGAPSCAGVSRSRRASS